MRNVRTTTSIPAHSLKKGDIVILAATELVVKGHPIVDGAVVKAELEYLGSIVRDEVGNTIIPSTISHHSWPCNGPVTILVGGNSGGSGA